MARHNTEKFLAHTGETIQVSCQLSADWIVGCLSLPYCTICGSVCVCINALIPLVTVCLLKMASFVACKCTSTNLLERCYMPYLACGLVERKFFKIDLLVSSCPLNVIIIIAVTYLDCVDMHCAHAALASVHNLILVCTPCINVLGSICMCINYT